MSTPCLDQPRRSLVEVMARRCADAYLADGPAGAASVYLQCRDGYGLTDQQKAELWDHYLSIVNRYH